MVNSRGAVSLTPALVFIEATSTVRYALTVHSFITEGEMVTVASEVMALWKHVTMDAVVATGARTRSTTSIIAFAVALG